MIDWDEYFKLREEVVNPSRLGPLHMLEAKRQETLRTLALMRIAEELSEIKDELIEMRWGLSHKEVE